MGAGGNHASMRKERYKVRDSARMDTWENVRSRMSIGGCRLEFLSYARPGLLTSDHIMEDEFEIAGSGELDR
jgi:hypothetical protein